jgi:hypothetical protein
MAKKNVRSQIDGSAETERDFSTTQENHMETSSESTETKPRRSSRSTTTRKSSESKKSAPEQRLDGGADSPVDFIS